MMEQERKQILCRSLRRLLDFFFGSAIMTIFLSVFMRIQMENIGKYKKKTHMICLHIFKSKIWVTLLSCKLHRRIISKRQSPVVPKLGRCPPGLHVFQLSLPYLLVITCVMCVQSEEGRYQFTLSSHLNTPDPGN